MALYKDSWRAVEERVEDLLSRMTLPEKVGQMTQIERLVTTPEVIARFFIGSILSGGGSAPEPNATTKMWADMVDGFQRVAMDTRLSIPIIYGIDAVHGHNNVYGATVFPHNIGLGATRDSDLAKKIGAATALETRATGIHYDFAPCIAVCRDPRWGRCYESFGEDTELVKKMADMILGLQGELPQGGYPAGIPFVASGGHHVAACAKHFVGDGGTIGGINEGNTVIDYDGLLQIHMAPYYTALEHHVSTVMISYSSWNGTKMHAHHELVSHILKQQMGFKGFTITDWEALERIKPSEDAEFNYSYSVNTVINAGIDMVMLPFKYEQFTSEVIAQVNAGLISQDRIDDAVRRILRVKFIAGLFEKPMAERSLDGVVGNESHRKLAREAVRKSLVLLKNGKNPESPMLPLLKTAPKILVAGSHANDIGLQCGGWTISWDGGSGQTTIGTTILEAIKNTVSPYTEVVYEESPDVNFFTGKDFSYAIVVVGEPCYVETKGDDNVLEIPEQGIKTIQNVCGSVKSLVVLISGRPLVIEPYLSLADAFVAAWLPGSECQGIADVIFGDFDFQGKSPRTWFKTVDQLPMNVGDEHYDPLFPYGFGLSMGVGK